MDPGPCQVLYSEKGTAILQDKFYRYLAGWLLPPSSPDMKPLDIAGSGVLEYFTIKTSHLNLVSLKATICKGGAVFSGDVLVQTCKSFHQCVEATIAKNVGHID